MAERLDAAPARPSFACGKRAPPEVVPGTPRGTVCACFPRQSSGAAASRRRVEAVPARLPPCVRAGDLQPGPQASEPRDLLPQVLERRVITSLGG